MTSSYKTKGRKEKQEELFPQLAKEIDEERKKIVEKSEIKWPDQEAKEYKEENLELLEKGAANVQRHITSASKFGNHHQAPFFYIFFCR